MIVTISLTLAPTSFTIRSFTPSYALFCVAAFESSVIVFAVPDCALALLKETFASKTYPRNTPVLMLVVFAPD